MMGAIYNHVIKYKYPLPKPFDSTLGKLQPFLIIEAGYQKIHGIVDIKARVCYIIILLKDKQLKNRK